MLLSSLGRCSSATTIARCATSSATCLSRIRSADNRRTNPRCARRSSGLERRGVIAGAVVVHPLGPLKELSETCSPHERSSGAVAYAPRARTRRVGNGGGLVAAEGTTDPRGADGQIGREDSVGPAAGAVSELDPCVQALMPVLLHELNNQTQLLTGLRAVLDMGGAEDLFAARADDLVRAASGRGSWASCSACSAARAVPTFCSRAAIRGRSSTSWTSCGEPLPARTGRSNWTQ